ncbi:glycoprotease family-domain-containing protein [Xylaria longipes]|nr:glycoprotease family-domain-containing protein [Xylaria longipes]
MSKLWRSSRQCLPGGNLFPQRPSSTARQPRPSSSTRLRPRFSSQQTRRQLVTLAIETSCDDTCVAILEKTSAGAARLHFNEKITSDNRAFRGVHPVAAVISHTEHLAPLVQRALRALPKAAGIGSAQEGGSLSVDGCLRLKPNFVSVTRGPGMTSNLATGLNLAKGLAVAWDVPLLAVNHMQAHALTPQLVSALQDNKTDQAQDPASETTETGGPRGPQFPFLSLLVSGGHTILVRSNSLNDHTILANAGNIAVGDMLDKCARMVLPPEILSTDDSDSGMYGPMFEEFAFPGSKGSTRYDYSYKPPARRADEIRIIDSGHDWTLTPPLAHKGKAAASEFDFAGLNGQVQKLMLERPDMDVDMRRKLARLTMTLVFEHLTGRLVFALQSNERSTGAEEKNKIKTVVLSGGVASNKFLRHVVRQMLDVRGYADVEVVAPPVALCTDNAAMIAWTGMEMYENGWRSDLSVLAMRKWPLDPNAEGGGILEAKDVYMYNTLYNTLYLIRNTTIPRLGWHYHG